MKIAILTTNFTRWDHDYRVPFIIDAAKAIQFKGHTVRIITPHQPGSVEYETIDGLEIFRIKYLPEKYEVLQQDAAGIPAAWEKSLLHKLALIPFFGSLFWGAVKHAKGCDIIHANWTLAGFAAYLSQLWHHCPYVITVHGSDIFRTINNPFLRIPVKIALNHASTILAVSEALAESLRSISIPEGKIQVIPTGIEIQKFPMSESSARDKVLLYVGSLIERKGVIYLIQAMEQVKTYYPDYKLKIIGEGDLRPALETTVESLDLKERVEFLGPQSQEEVSQWMRKAKLFILPSLEEGQGAVLVEAMASGTPCIGSNIGGIPSVIIPEVGRTFEPGNSLALFRAIQQMLEDEQIWEKASRQSRLRAEEKYDWNNLATQIIQVYEEILQENLK